jgi:hypothetical protein
MPESELARGREQSASCTRPAKRASGSVRTRVAIGLGLVVLVGLAAFWLRPSEERIEGSSGTGSELLPNEERRGAPAAQAQERADFVLEPDADGHLRIPASRLEGGEPILLEIGLTAEEIGDEPMAVRLRTAGKTHDVGFAELDRVSGRARISIPASMLSPGKSLLMIRTAQPSWNPDRRVVITVAE